MGVSITVSGSVFWAVYVDVPLNKNFGISTFGISAFPTSFTDLFVWLKFLLMTPKAFESKLQRGHTVVPLVLQPCVPGDLLSVLKRGIVRAARSVSPSEPFAMLTLMPHSITTFVYCHGIQSSALGRDGLPDCCLQLSRSINTDQRLSVLQKVLQFWKPMSAFSSQFEHELFVLKYQQSYD